MTSPPSPPNRRRRRIVATVVLVLVSTVSWWYWPRGDARFVGRWAILNEQREIGDVIEFHPDGRCHQSFQGVAFSGFKRWWVEGDEIVLDRYPTNVSDIVGGLPSLLRKIVGGDAKGYIRLRVSKLSTEEFDFELTTPDGTPLGTPLQTARRIPE